MHRYCFKNCCTICITNCHVSGTWRLATPATFSCSGTLRETIATFSAKSPFACLRRSKKEPDVIFRKLSKIVCGRVTVVWRSQGSVSLFRIESDNFLAWKLCRDRRCAGGWGLAVVTDQGGREKTRSAVVFVTDEPCVIGKARVDILLGRH